MICQKSIKYYEIVEFRILLSIVYHYLILHNAIWDFLWAFLFLLALSWSSKISQIENFQIFHDILFGISHPLLVALHSTSAKVRKSGELFMVSFLFLFISSSCGKGSDNSVIFWLLCYLIDNFYEKSLKLCDQICKPTFFFPSKKKKSA